MSRSHSPRPPRREAVLGHGIIWLSTWTLRWVIILVGAVLAGWALQHVWSIVLPVLLALILTSVLQPPARLLERRLRFPPVLAALTVLGGLILLVSAVVLWIAPSIGCQVLNIANSASDALIQIERWVRDSDLGVSDMQVNRAVDAAQHRLRTSASLVAFGVLIGLSAAVTVVVNTLITLVLTFFLKDGRKFLPWLRGLSGPRVGTHLHEVGGRAWEVLGGFVRTQALVGLIDAVLIGAGLVIVGVPLALPLALLTFVGAFAPVIGAVTVGGLAVLVALVTNGWLAAVVILGVVLVVQQLEGNVLLPWLQGRSLNLHAGVVLLAVVLGSTLFGVTGAFLAVPLVAVAATTLRYVDEQVTEATTGRDVGETPGSGP